MKRDVSTSIYSELIKPHRYCSTLALIIPTIMFEPMKVFSAFVVVLLTFFDY